MNLCSIIFMYFVFIYILFFLYLGFRKIMYFYTIFSTFECVGVVQLIKS